MGIIRDPTKNLRLVDLNDRCLKSRIPIGRRRRRARLGFDAVIAGAFPAELRRRSKKMEMERKSENRDEKNGRG